MRANKWLFSNVPSLMPLLLWVLLAVPVLAETVTFTYDALDRLTSATYGTSRINYVYDSAGNITQVVTPSGCDTLYYRDADGDGFGDPNAVLRSCTQPAGFVTNNTDCNDTPVTGYYEHPGQTWYPDTDGDGYYYGPVITNSCTRPAAHYAAEELATITAQDNSPTAPNPDQMDTDGDGDGDVSDAFPNNVDYSLDTDGDGIADEWEIAIFGNLTAADATSDTDSDGISDLKEFNLGMDPKTSIFANKDEEISYLTEMLNYLNWGDQDFDGDVDGDDLKWFTERFGYTEIDVDDDGDTFSEIQGDCDDADATIHPDATEDCDGVDNNCNGTTDEDCD